MNDDSGRAAGGSVGGRGRRPGRWRWGRVAALALFAGLLFWTKLRLVSHVPRSAYAEPEATASGEARGSPTPADAGASDAGAAAQVEDETADGAGDGGE